MEALVQAGILIWLLACAVFDVRRREVPDWLTLPAVGLGLAWQVFHPQGWLPWALAGATIGLTLAGLLPGGDMKGLVAMAWMDVGLYLYAWLGAAVVYALWRAVRREKTLPGYLGFLVGGVLEWISILCPR